MLGTLRGEHFGRRAALDHRGELVACGQGCRAQVRSRVEILPRALDRAALDKGLALPGQRVDVIGLEPQRVA